MLSCWLLLSVLFLFSIESLMLALLVLELMALVLFTFSSLALSSAAISSSFLVVLFSIFVMGGVIGLSSLVLLVSFTGLDYLSSSSLLKF